MGSLGNWIHAAKEATVAFPAETRVPIYIQISNYPLQTMDHALEQLDNPKLVWT